MKPMRKLLLLLLCVALSAAAFTGCGESGGGSGDSGAKDTGFKDGYPKNVLRIATSAEEESGDPQLTSADYLIPLNIFDTPITVISLPDGTSELQPGLAESWDISADGKSYTLHLRQGVKYTNGEELKADDVLYTIDRMLNPKRMAKNTECMSMLDGAQDMMDGKLTTLAEKGVTILDDYTVQLNLNSSYAPFLATLSVPGWSIYNRKAGDAADEAGGGISGSYFGSNPEYTIGTGPFILKEWVVNDHMYLEANKDYWQGAPKIDGILVSVIPDGDTMKMMYESGQLDIFDLDNAREQIATYMKSDKYKEQIVPKVTLGTTYLSINERIKPFGDVRVRKALQMAINKQAILDTLYEGTGIPANGIFPPGLVCFNKDLHVIPYDKEAAKKLLTEAGYPNGFDMKIAQSSGDSKSSIQCNEIIQAQLAEIGVNVKIDQMDEASWYDVRRTGDLPMYMSTWWGDYNDPDNFIYTFFSKDSTVSRSFNYYNQAAMKKIEDARYMTDSDARMKEYQDLEKLVIQDDAAWIPLFHLEKVRLVQPRVHGFIPQWAGWGDCSYYSVSLD